MYWVLYYPAKVIENYQASKHTSINKQNKNINSIVKCSSERFFYISVYMCLLIRIDFTLSILVPEIGSEIM